MVTSAFLARINNLFPHHLTFHLTCQKQQEQMEKIRTSCTNLSREVEDRFQKYLNNVGDKVANIQVQYSELEVKSSHLNSDLQACELTHAGLAGESAQKIQEVQQTHDTRMRTLLEDKNQLRQEKDNQSQRLAVMEAEAQTLRARIQTLSSAQSNCKYSLAGSTD
ncbi:hypothetical protein CRUP_024216 [Coryphaenoides rupestris]|nr:hypothetical protein CRUP_024216 [Coryphaenoides rupestris]